MKICKKCNQEFEGRQCRNCMILYKKIKYIENRERYLLEASIYYEANKDKVKAKNKIWLENNKEKDSIRRSLYRKKNPEIYKLAKHKRRELVKSGGIISKGIIEKLYLSQKGKCVCCNLPLGNDYHLDHIMPIALGGRNEDSNVQLLRAKCNREKSYQHPIDFMQSRGYLL